MVCVAAGVVGIRGGVGYIDLAITKFADVAAGDCARRCRVDGISGLRALVAMGGVSGTVDGCAARDATTRIYWC